MNIKGNNGVDASSRHAITPLAIWIEATEYRYKNRDAKTNDVY